MANYLTAMFTLSKLSLKNIFTAFSGINLKLYLFLIETILAIKVFSCPDLPSSPRMISYQQKRQTKSLKNTPSGIQFGLPSWVSS